MENGQIHAAADLSVDLLIVVSEFFQTFLQVLEIIFFWNIYKSKLAQS